MRTPQKKMEIDFGGIFVTGVLLKGQNLAIFGPKQEKIKKVCLFLLRFVHFIFLPAF